MDIVQGIVKDLIQDHYDYISECEKDSTKIEQKIASIKLRTKKIQANNEILEKYFQYQMKEREKLFNSASVVLEKAIERGDFELAQVAIKTIEIVHKKSPFSF